MFRLQMSLVDPNEHRGPSWPGQLELLRSLCFALHEYRLRQALTTVQNVANTQIDEIIAAQLATEAMPFLRRTT